MRRPDGRRMIHLTEIGYNLSGDSMTTSSINL